MWNSSAKSRRSDKRKGAPKNSCTIRSLVCNEWQLWTRLFPRNLLAEFENQWADSRIYSILHYIISVLLDVGWVSCWRHSSVECVGINPRQFRVKTMLKTEFRLNIQLLFAKCILPSNCGLTRSNRGIYVPGPQFPARRFPGCRLLRR
jgi:hypothetical protein